MKITKIGIVLLLVLLVFGLVGCGGKASKSSVAPGGMTKVEANAQNNQKAGTKTSTSVAKTKASINNQFDQLDKGLDELNKDDSGSDSLNENDFK